MSAREHILGAVRRRLDRSAEDAGSARARLDEHPAGPVPAAARGTPEQLEQRFAERAEAAAAEVWQLASIDELPARVAALAEAAGYPASVAVAPDDALTGAPWAAAGLDAEGRAAHAEDRVCVSRARLAIAETGTVLLRSGPESPVTLNFLGEVHVVALERARIVGDYESAWGLLRSEGALPRTVNWITGPSRSADIEQTLQLGAHGPVRLIVALVD